MGEIGKGIFIVAHSPIILDFEGIHQGKTL
jgi:hypothetical protein